MPAQLAQALYDNAAESPEELSFRRGDVMLVLEKDAPTLGGWWRCSLKGKQGIAPGNRLRLLPETNGQENEYQAPRLIGATPATPKLQNSEDKQQEETHTEVYQVPSIARLCISSSQDEIYNSPRQIEASQPCPQEVYDKPSSLLRDVQYVSETYDSPVLRVKDVVAPKPEEIPEDIYDVPPTFQNVPSDNEDDEGIYSMPSNLKRVSGLQNLYEAPEDIFLSGNVPEALEPPPQTHRLSVSSTGSARSADSGGSRESGLPSLLSRDPRNEGISTMESLNLLHQEVQRTVTLTVDKLQKGSSQGCIVFQAQVVEALKDFVGLAQVVLLHSCQASDPSLHRQISGHLEKLECALEALQEGRNEISVTNSIQEQSSCIVALVAANAGLLFPRPRLSSNESLSRRPLPALPTAPSPATHRKGSIQDRPLPAPPIIHQIPSDPGEDAHSEYEKIQCRDNHYVHLQGSVTAQTIQKSKDWLPDVDQQNSQEKKVDQCPEPSEDDRHLLRFYASQSHGHLQTLQVCVDTFLGSASSQPPRVFVGHGKQLVIAAHKLVFIGDTLGRLLSCTQLQAKLAGEGGVLCQALKEVVLATKEAAALFPSPIALKAMAASVYVLCTCARSFTDLLQKLAS